MPINSPFQERRSDIRYSNDSRRKTALIAGNSLEPSVLFSNNHSDWTISREARKGTFNDYPEREYSQVAGKGRQVERFWSKTKRNPSNGCLEWTASIASKRWPYGQFGLKKWGFKSPQRAHRVAWMLHHGPIPDDKVILHICDNPRCVEISHLRIGTHADNIHDKEAKGRHGKTGASGERNGLAKLNAQKVRKIREATGTLKSIADRFGVGISCVHAIRTRQTWKHI